jgi:hypothetical protein
MALQLVRLFLVLLALAVQAAQRVLALLLLAQPQCRNKVKMVGVAAKDLWLYLGHDASRPL